MVKDVKGGYRRLEKDAFGTIVDRGVEGVLGAAKSTVNLFRRSGEFVRAPSGPVAAV